MWRNCTSNIYFCLIFVHFVVTYWNLSIYIHKITVYTVWCCMYMYVFHTIEVYIVYYHVGIYIWYFCQMSKPRQCFHSFIYSTRVCFVKQFGFLKMNVFSVVFQFKSMQYTGDCRSNLFQKQQNRYCTCFTRMFLKILGPANPFVSF